MVWIWFHPETSCSCCVQPHDLSVQILCTCTPGVRGFASLLEQRMVAKSASGLLGSTKCTLPTPRRNLLSLDLSISSGSPLLWWSSPCDLTFLPKSPHYSMPSSSKYPSFGISLKRVGVFHNRVPKNTTGCGLITSVIFVVKHCPRVENRMPTGIWTLMHRGSSTSTNIFTLVSV